MTQQEFLATAGFPDTPEGRAAFYREYDSPEKFYAKHGGSLSGAPHNGQPTADEFFSYGAPALGHMNIPMSNPTYLAHGGTYFGGPIRPYQEGGDTRTVSQMWKEVTGLPWSEAKKNGVTDGSYEANMQLRNALLKGSFTNLSDIGQAPRFRASKQEPQQEEQINPIAAGRTAANIMSAPTPQSLLVSKKPSSKVKATQVDKAITKTTKKAPPAKHIDAGAFQVVDNITGVTADYFKNSPLPGVVNTPNVNTPGPFLQKAKMEQVHMFPKTKAGTPSQLKKGPTDKRKIPQSGLVVDKRTNQAYYFGDKGQKGSFPVLTGANPDLNYNIYTEAELDKNPELRNTPTGYYNLFPQSDVYGEKGFANLPIPAYGVPAPAAKELYTHVTYDPKNRGKLYKRSADNRAVTWGCTNCEKPNINTLTSVFPKGDTALVLDSKRAADLALLQQAQARLNQKRYGGLPMAQDGYYNLTPEEAEYLKNNPLYEDDQYNVSDDTHDLKFVIGPNNTISNFQKRNPKWKEEKTTKYVNIPLEGEDYEFAKKHLENDIKDKYQQSLVEKLNRDVTSYTPSDSFKQYINTLNERKKKGETLDGYDDIYHYMIDNTQGKPLSKHMLENYQGYHPAALAKYLQKEYFDKKYGGGLYKQSYGGDITEYCWGGGLPGGANEMKRMDYGGYMDMGGYNSPTNYGSFSVPMNEGGEDSNDPPTFKALNPKDSAAVAERLKAIEKRYPMDKYDLIYNSDSTVIKPFNLKTNKAERLSDYYKWDPKKKLFGKNDEWVNYKALEEKMAKQFAKKNLPSPKSGVFAETFNLLQAQNEERIKREKERQGIPTPLIQEQEYGGALDASNNQDYPMMEEGGRANLMKIIKAASKKMKKEYATGGKVTMQGGNQNQLDNMNNYFKSFIQQNANNAFVEEEEKSFRMGGVPMAAGGWELSPEYRNSEKRSQVIKALENKKKIAINQNLSDDQLLDMARKEGIIVDTPDNQSQNTAQNTPSIASMFKQLAQDFGPQSRTQGYSNFPANFRSYWQANKAGRESINSLPDNFQLGNLKGSLEYDLLGKTWIGKKLGWGPKRINFELSGTSQYKNTPYKQGPQVQLADPNNPLFKPYSQYNTGAPEGTLQTNKGSFAPLDFHIGKQQGPMAYGGLYKAVEGVGTPISMGQGVALKGTAPGGTSLDSLYSLPVASSISTPANVEQMKKQAGRETEQLYKTEMQGDTGTTNVSAKGAFERDNSGLLETAGQYAVPGLNLLSKAIEAPGQKEAEEKALLAARTPGSDTSFVAANPGDTPDIGDYDQWGNFRANRKVAGPMYGEYGGMFEQGGFYEEGEEYDLSPEQMEYLRNQGYDFDILEDID